LFIKDLSIVLKLLAVTNTNILLLFEALKGEPVLFSELLEVRAIQNIQQFLG